MILLKYALLFIRFNLQKDDCKKTRYTYKMFTLFLSSKITDKYDYNKSVTNNREIIRTKTEYKVSKTIMNDTTTDSITNIQPIKPLVHN